jgi:hypothetical protein
MGALRTAFREKRSPPFASGQIAQWTTALGALYIQGKLDIVEHGIRHLHALHPTVPYAANTVRFFDQLPRAGDQLPFTDDSSKDVQLVRRENADTVLFVFCDAVHHVGMPLSAAHRWLGRLPASVVYLRDQRSLRFLAGVRSLADGRAATVRSLADIAASLNARRILCYGNSGGSFAAMLYGLELGAEAVAAIAGMTNLTTEFNAHLRNAEILSDLQKAFPDAPKDLRQIYATAPRTPRVLALYGEDHWDDRLHAEYLRGVPGVTLQPIPGSMEHNCVLDLVRRGQFQDMLDWLVRRSGQQATPMPGPVEMRELPHAASPQLRSANEGGAALQ